MITECWNLHYNNSWVISLFSKTEKKKLLLLFIVDTKSFLLQTRHFLLYLGIFIHSTLLGLRDKPLRQSLNHTSPSNLGNIRYRSGCKLSSWGLSFVMVNQQAADLNNLFILKFGVFFLNCTSFLANKRGLFSSLQDRKLFTAWLCILNCYFIFRGKSWWPCLPHSLGADS